MPPKNFKFYTFIGRFFTAVKGLNQISGEQKSQKSFYFDLFCLLDVTYLRCDSDVNRVTDSGFSCMRNTCRHLPHINMVPRLS